MTPLVTQVLAVIAGLSLGFVGALGHLLITRWRASLLLHRGLVVAALTFPLGLAAPVAAVLVAAWFAPLAAWVSPLGIVLARAMLLRRLGGA